MFEVIYSSCTGNTKKVAEAMAAALGVTAKDVKTAGTVSEEAFIFLGTGCYNGELPEEVKAFMKENGFAGRNIALFTTSAFNFVTEREKMEKQLAENGARIVRSFRCYGRLLDINKDHPTWLELKKAAWFARSAAITLFSKYGEAAEILVPVR